MRSSTKYEARPEQITALVARHFDGQAPATVVELTDGWFNAAYALTLDDGRELVLKIAPPPQARVMRYERDLLATEVAMLRLARQDASIPVPAVLAHDTRRDIVDAPCFFMQRLPGSALNQLRPLLSPAEAEAVDTQLGRIVHALNRIPGRVFGYEGHPGLRAPRWREAFVAIFESVLADAADQGVVLDPGAETLRALLQRHAPVLDEVHSPCLVHWDGWDANVFVHEGRVCGLIDFERALWADPLMEAQFRPLSWSGVSAAMRGYGKTTFTPAERCRCELYTLHLALVMVTECFFRHYDTDAVLQRARRMLADSVAWLGAH